jgi:hypothetical protein
MCHYLEPACLLDAQRDGGAVEANLEWIATERPADERELGPFDQSQDHQPLDGRIGGVDRLDTGNVTGFEVGQCQTSAPRQRRK